MKAGNHLIDRIQKIPINTNLNEFIEKYLQKIGKEIATCFQVEHCGLLLYTQSTLLPDIFVHTYERQDTSFLYLENESFPWLQKDNRIDLNSLKDLDSLEETNPLKQSLIGLFGHPLRSGIIIPVSYNQAVTGSIILLYEYKIHLFTTYEKNILNQVSNHLTYVIEKLVKSKMMKAARKIFFNIDLYHQELSHDEEQNKKPDIIAEILKKVVDLKSVYIMKKNGTRGNRWYHADIKENGAIKSKNGTFSDSTFEFLLEEVKKDCPDFIDIPIKDRDSIIGKLFVDYGKREKDQPFKDVIYKIFLGTANALARLMYT